jgi:transketolase
MIMDEKKVSELQKKSNDIRKEVLEMCILGKTGHVTSSFSCAELLTALYFGNIMRYNPQNPKWENRDRFILSKGQASPILYVVLSNAGFFPKHWLTTFCDIDAKFGVHLQNNVPGVEFTTGSLGHGLGLGAGVALAAKLNQKNYHTFVLLGDAELYEGSVWEAAMFASQHNLNNLVAIIDRNGFGVLQPTEDFLKLEPLEEKFKSFGWEVKRINGHSIKDIFNSLENFRGHKRDKPLMIVADTIKGKGIKFIENVALWHGVAPVKQDDVERARKELREYSIEQEYQNKEKVEIIPYGEQI